MASLAACDDSVGKEVFLRHPPPPFDCDFVQGECRRTDMDEDWLPDVQDLISGNYNLLIDLAGDSDHEGDDESCSMAPQSDSGTVLPAPRSIGPRASPSSERPPLTCPLSKTVDGLELDEVEIPEYPGAIPISPAASIQSRHLRDGDGGAASVAATVITQAAAPGSTEQEQEQEQEQEEQEQGQQHERDREEGQECEETYGGGGDDFLSSRQPDAPVMASTIQLLESGMSERQNPEAVLDRHPGTQSASQIVSPAREVVCTGSGPYVGIQDIALFHIEGQRETAHGPEYLFVGRTWLTTGAGVRSDLVQAYRREVVRKDRLATLRTRKRTREEAASVEAARFSAQKKVKAGCLHLLYDPAGASCY